MYRRIRQFFHNLSIQHKLLLSYLSICFLCFLILFCFGAPQIAKQAEDNIQFSAKKSLDQTEAYISYYMDNMLQYAYSLAYNDTLLDIAIKDPANYTLQEQSVDKNTLQTLAVNVTVTHSKTISNVHFYLNDGFAFLSDGSTSFRPYSIVRDSTWYDESSNMKYSTYYIPPTLNLSPDTISVIHYFSHPEDYSNLIGAVMLDTPSKNIESILQNCSVTSGGFSYLVNETGILIATSNRELTEIDIDIVSAAMDNKGTLITDESIYYVSKLNPCKWYLVQVLPIHDIEDVRNSALGLFIFIGILLLIVSIILATSISYGITRRLSLLSSSMRTFRFNKTTPIHVPKHGDDIDYLLESYNMLISELRTLNEESIHNANRLNESELALLHTQINPHFLFNTLDMIRSLSDEHNADNVSLAISALSRFYRTGIGKDKIWSTLRQELDHISAYMEIQGYRFGANVSLIVDIPDELMDINLPRITLQPIVENALLHGLQNIKEKAATITISIQQFNDNEVVLSIRDNGRGMSQEKLVELFQSGKFGNGIGLNNTNERIRIHYGPAYGLSIQSVEYEYTEVSIKIPLLRGMENLPYRIY